MKFVVVALALVAVVASAPPADQVPQIVRSDFESKPDGGYVYSVETEDGTVLEQQGEVKEALDEENKPHTVVVVKGSYSYIDDAGNKQTVTYVADENGYQPEGDSIPKVASRRR